MQEVCRALVRRFQQVLESGPQRRARDDADADLDADDGPPAMKRYKTVHSHFPKIMPKEDEEWSVPRRVAKPPKIHYIPVTKEEHIPSTSMSSNRLQSSSSNNEHKATCLRTSLRPRPSVWDENSAFPCTCTIKKTSKSPDIIRVQERPVHILKESGNRFYRKQYINQPVVAVVNVDDDDDDDDDDKECIYVESAERPRESLIYKNGNGRVKNDNDDTVELSDSEYDVIQVKRVASTPKEILDTSKRKYSRDYRSSDRLRSGEVLKSARTPLRHQSARNSTSGGISKAQSRIGWATRLHKAVDAKKPLQMAIFKSFRLDEKKNFRDLIEKTKSLILPKSNYARSQISLSNSEPKSSPFEKSTTQYIDLTESKYSKFDRLINGNGVSRPSTSKVFDKSDFLTDAKANASFETIDADLTKSKDDSSNSSTSFIKYQNRLELLMQNKPITRSSWIDTLSKKYAEISLHRESEVKKIEDGVEEEELPELTDEQELKVKNALRPTPANEVLIEKFNLSIHRRDIHTLSGLNWLNDEVINFYMNLIMERSEQKKNLPKVYGMNTFFFPRLAQAGHSGIKRWTRKVDIFSYDLMLVPIHLGVHWCMSIIDFRNKNVKYYDSMGGRNMECCNTLLKYLQDERMDKKREKFDTSSWDLECVKDIPQQMNGSDCGMFSCMFAEFLSRSAEITFSQNDMPYFRRKMILEIIEGQLLI